MCTCKECVFIRQTQDGSLFCSDSISEKSFQHVDPDSSCSFFVEDIDDNTRKFIHELRLKFVGFHEVSK